MLFPLNCLNLHFETARVNRDLLANWDCAYIFDSGEVSVSLGKFRNGKRVYLSKSQSGSLRINRRPSTVFLEHHVRPSL